MKIDHILLEKVNIESLDSDMFKDIVLGGMGIAGVILGLFFIRSSTVIAENPVLLKF